MEIKNDMNEFIVQNRDSFDNKTPFEGHFDRFKDKLETNTNKTAYLINWKYIAIAASLGFVIMSMVSTYFYGNNQANIASIENDMRQMRETMILSLIENQSASKRLKAVNYIEGCKSPVDDIITALINTLHHDENSNVRLAAAEGLIKFSNIAEVRKGFLDALIFEKDPNIQIELINILVAIKEKNGIEPMRNMLKNKETPEFMKEQIEEGISDLMIKI